MGDSDDGVRCTLRLNTNTSMDRVNLGIPKTKQGVKVIESEYYITVSYRNCLHVHLNVCKKVGEGRVRRGIENGVNSIV